MKQEDDGKQKEHGTWKEIRNRKEKKGKETEGHEFQFNGSH